MLKKLWRKWGPNPLDKLLKSASAKGQKRILIPWNRGLGDIALGLYAIVYRIREFIPDAEITFLTRKDLVDGFALLERVQVQAAPEWRRGTKTSLPENLPFDLILENADPTNWVAWQRGKLSPKLKWNPDWDALWKKFGLPQNCIGAHVACETNYYNERDWPSSHWETLFSAAAEPIVLFGFQKTPLFSQKNIFDLRGELSLFELLSIIKNALRVLIAPDSGVLSMAYYLDIPFPLKVISLWADPHHGVLKQNTPSPNPLLTHIPLISRNQKNAALISVEEVKKAIC